MIGSDDDVTLAHEALEARRRVAELVQKTEEADADGDLDRGFRLRQQLVNELYWVPDSRELVAAYAWLLARHDEDQRRFPLSLWSYKWVVIALPNMTSVSLEQIEQVLVDVGRRFEAQGEPPTTVLKLRLAVARDTRQLDGLEDAHAAWRMSRDAGRGALNDCRACDDADHVATLVMLGREAEALEAAEELLSGDSACASEPHYTLPDLVGPMRRLRGEAAADSLRGQAYRLVRDDPRFLSAIGPIIRDLVQAERIDEAVRLVARHQAWARSTNQDEASLWEFSSAARATFRRLGELGRDIPESLADLREPVRSAAEVAAALTAQAEDLGRRFDARNGNSWYTDRLAEDGNGQAVEPEPVP